MSRWEHACAASVFDQRLHLAIRTNGRRVHAFILPNIASQFRVAIPERMSIFRPPLLWNTFTASIWMTGQFLVHYSMIAMFASCLQKDLKLGPGAVALPTILHNAQRRVRALQLTHRPPLTIKRTVCPASPAGSTAFARRLARLAERPKGGWRGARVAKGDGL